MGVLAALMLAPAFLAHSKSRPKTSDAEVQVLANFPALQRLGAKGDRDIRATLQRVAAAYRQVGYAAFAKELPRAVPLIALFGARQAEETPGTLRKARATVRRLEASLAGSPVLVPENAGETIPDYLGLALTFVANADRALANVKAGKNVANALRKKVGPLEVRNLDGLQISFTNPGTTGTTGAVSTQGSLSVTWAGGTSISGGSLTSDTVGAWANTELLSTGRWIAFPPEVEIPAGDAPSAQLNLANRYFVNDVEYPAGTRLIQVAETFVVPEGAVELASPVRLVPTFDTLGTSYTFGTSFTLEPSGIDRGGVETWSDEHDPARGEISSPTP